MRRVILAGGGNIGRRLAARWRRPPASSSSNATPRPRRCSPSELEQTIVLHGDAADEDLLREENIDRTDVFCAITNDDQVNILSCMLAKRLGARKVMALINRSAYVDLVESRS